MVSDIFIPPTFTLIGFIYLSLVYFETVNEKFIVILNAVVFGVLLPILFFVIYRKKKIVFDNDAVIKEQRFLPFITSIILSLLGFLIIRLFLGNTITSDLWLAISINTIGLLFINHFWKISAHAIGGATIVGLFYFLDSSLFPYFLILIVLIGWSRVKLKVHTPAQIVAGSIYGFLMTIIQLKFYSGA